ncbi:Hypothetical protein NTJ_13389 [Nesidiocoris tenuis]|uniref:Gustatory receptor n=1 Tax=Nesidiocoris tenuis TaxID=355587 RepID=A0ABN7B862_9HEMI|nr:Hypothetical protein NTJ_13389 [Nesidiocoris tenuis]
MLSSTPLRVKKSKVYNFQDLDDAFVLCRMLGTYPFNISCDRLSWNVPSVGVAVVFYILLIAARTTYITYVFTGLAYRESYRIIIHAIESGASVGVGIGIAITMVRYWKTADSYLEIQAEIKALLAFIADKKQPKKFVCRVALRCVHLIPLFVIIVNDLAEFGEFSVPERTMMLAAYFSNIRIFTFTLIYSIHVRWIGHIFETLIDNTKSANRQFLIRNGVALCKIEENVHVLCCKHNNIFAPSLILLILKSFIVMTNNLFWTIFVKQERLKIIQFAWVLAYLSYCLVMFNSAEYCLEKVRRC